MVSDHNQPVAANLLARQFGADRPNQRWVEDTTEILVGEHGAKPYLAAILDLYSRFVVETFYNRRRRHSSLDYLSPVDFEQRGRETLLLEAAA